MWVFWRMIISTCKRYKQELGLGQTVDLLEVTLTVKAPNHHLWFMYLCAADGHRGGRRPERAAGEAQHRAGQLQHRLRKEVS